MSVFEQHKQDLESVNNLFSDFRNKVLGIDPVSFVENNLTLDGKPFRLNGNGYKPFADIYRYIGLKAVEPGAKPVVLVKGRQVGATTMAAALEAYFTTCGLYGNNGRSPMRIMHLFPTLTLSTAFVKDKLNQIISTSKPVPGALKPNGMLKSFLECMIDSSSPANNSQHFKKFWGGNQVWIDSTGLDGDRIRGRQLSLDTDIPTPNGFVKLRDVKEGDQLFDEKGNVCNVIKLHPVQQTPEAYKITFDDGTVVEACAEHLWMTYTKKNRQHLNNFLKGRKKTPPKPTIKNTKEILATLKTHGESNHSIPNCLPVCYEKKELPLDPYLFGFWLGDGDRYGRIETADPEVLKKYNHKIIPSSINHKSNFRISKSCSYRVKGLTTLLTKIGVVCNPRDIKKGFYDKHIPDLYKYSSYDQRLALLQGLMDSDGCCYKDQRLDFTQVREKLVYDVYELITSLGIKARIYKKESWRYGVRYKDKYVITFITKLPVFRLKRKLEKIKATAQTKSTHRYIRSIEPIETKPMRCLTVDSPSHLFLITKSYIPTHNTTDCNFYDECFPYDQNIEIKNGKMKIGEIYKNFKGGKVLPLVKTFNEKTEIFEYKKITNAWHRGKKKLIQITCGNRNIRCTLNHPFLTNNGWIEAKNLKIGDLIKTTEPNLGQICYALNEDQEQIMLGSFLGDGCLSNHGIGKYRIREQHGKNQADYCFWKAEMFEVKTSIIEKNGYSNKPAVYYSTKLFCLDYELPQKKTYCPQWVLDKLDERGLAVWFMDDGAAIKNSGMLHTSSFDEDSQKRIVKKLNDFGIEARYKFYKRKNKNKEGYFAIYLPRKGYYKLCELISPYVHKNISYKILNYNKNNLYKWNNKFKNYGLIPVKAVKDLEIQKDVYDIEVEDNHNFIVTSVRRSKNRGGLIVHNCQDIPQIAIGAANKILAQAKYGPSGKGVQVFFGTPKTKGGAYWNMWQSSSQQYYHLKCEKCSSYFPLYRPDVDWEKIWLYGYIVKCTNCDHEQDKRDAAENGKWIALNNEEESSFIGYHINQLYIPHFTKETIIAEKPENSPINSERIYMNEVLGEFFDGEGGTVSIEELREKCGDVNLKMSDAIYSSEKRVYAGFDWGQKSALDQLSGQKKQGKSYSCGVILTAVGPKLFHINFATRFTKNDPRYKRETVDEMFRRYRINVGVGDIGDAFDLSHELQEAYGERFLVSRAVPKVTGHIRFDKQIFPKEIRFERDYYISELIGLLKNGNIKFPFGHYEQIEWLLRHCSSMEVKVTRNKSGDPIKHYIKGSSPNDGFMALLNAYLAWKWDITQGFKIRQPQQMAYSKATENKNTHGIVGYIPKTSVI